MVKVKKQGTPSCFAASKERKNAKAVGVATTADIPKEIKLEKEIKKEKQESLVGFDESPITKPIKEEEISMHAMMAVKADESKDKPIKDEPWEIPAIKSEPSPTEFCHLPSTTSFSTLKTTDGLQDTPPQPQPLPVTLAFAEQPHTAGMTVSVKQEVQQLSDSDDDFNVDLMLDNLDCEKSEHTEGSTVSVKQEKEVEEGAIEGGQLSTVLGVKSKNQVKRVTWNIQEPEGPQPEKSASSKWCRQMVLLLLHAQI